MRTAAFKPPVPTLSVAHANRGGQPEIQPTLDNARGLHAPQFELLQPELLHVGHRVLPFTEEGDLKNPESLAMFYSMSVSNFPSLIPDPLAQFSFKPKGRVFRWLGLYCRRVRLRTVRGRLGLCGIRR